MLDLIGCGRYIGFQFIGYVCDDHHAPIENDVDIYGAYYKLENRHGVRLPIFR